MSEQTLSEKLQSAVLVQTQYQRRYSITASVASIVVVRAECQHAGQFSLSAEVEQQRMQILEGPWRITVSGLPGDDFTVTHHGRDIEQLVERLAGLVAMAAAGSLPSTVGPLDALTGEAL